jgi:hypothetical protein
MTEDWPRHLARTLVSGFATATLEQHLDALLIWLGNPENPHVATLDTAIANAGLTRHDAAERAYDTLDRLLFSEPRGAAHRILGLPATVDLHTAKLRYRCLIQAYHPDRHPARAQLHNERTEQINTAYVAFERRERNPTPVPKPNTPRSKSKRRPAKARRTPKPVEPSRRGAAFQHASVGTRLRRRLGRPETFQWRFFVGLILICGALLALLLYSEAPQQRPTNQPAPTKTTPET